MKKPLLLLAFSTVVGMLLLTNCSNSNDSKTNIEAKKMLSETSELTGVPLKTALEAIARYGEWWRAQAEGDTSVHIDQVTRAFLIPGKDLISVLNPTTDSTIIDYCEYKHARAYLGLDTNNIIHLYLTPVGEDNNDVFLSSPNGKIVFDLTVPCPTNCDVTSELYKAFDN
jgi:hypothetical protein